MIKLRLFGVARHSPFPGVDSGVVSWFARDVRYQRLARWWNPVEVSGEPQYDVLSYCVDSRGRTICHTVAADKDGVESVGPDTG